MTTNTIAELNDRLRRGEAFYREIVLTSGVISLGSDRITELIKAIAEFDDFDEGNDPYGERDFGAIEFEGERYFWKISYYDLNLQNHSPDPANPLLTKRVMAVMLASEY